MIPSKFAYIRKNIYNIYTLSIINKIHILENEPEDLRLRRIRGYVRLGKGKLDFFLLLFL